MVLLLLLPTACVQRSSDVRSTPTPPAVIRVVNQNFADVRIVLLRAGVRLPLGTVASMTTRDLAIPRTAVGIPGVRLAADPLGGEAVFTSEPVVLDEHGVVEWTLAHDLRYSSFAVR